MKLPISLKMNAQYWHCNNNQRGRWIYEAHWGIFVLTQSWAEVTAANCHSTFAWIVLTRLAHWPPVLRLSTCDQVQSLVKACFCFQVLGVPLSLPVQGTPERAVSAFTPLKSVERSQWEPLCHHPWLSGFKHKPPCLFINLHVLYLYLQDSLGNKTDESATNIHLTVKHSSRQSAFTCQKRNNG